MRDKSIEPTNNKGQRHGLWELYFKGNLIYKCFYHNDKLVGYNGKISKKKYNL
jgi:hypothetical protein